MGEKVPTKLKFTANLTYEVECDSIAHAENVAQALRMWCEREMNRMESIRSTKAFTQVIEQVREG